MGLNSPFTRALIQRLVNDPNVRRAVNKIKAQVQKHPTTQKFVHDIKSKLSKAAASSTAATQHGNSNQSTSNSASNAHSSSSGGGSTQQSTTTGGNSNNQQQGGGDFFKRGQQYWDQHRERVIAFVAANFMGILFFIQFGQQIWHLVVIALRSPDGKHVEERKKKKPRVTNEQQQLQRMNAQPQVRPPSRPGDPLQLSLNLEEGSGGMAANAFDADPIVAFEESFSVKMGDSKNFQSSLDSEFVTGDLSSSSKGGIFSGLVALGDNSEELIFDMRFQSKMAAKNS